MLTSATSYQPDPAGDCTECGRHGTATHPEGTCLPTRPPVLGTALLDSGDFIDRLGDGTWWNTTEQRPATAEETTEGIELLLLPEEGA